MKIVVACEYSGRVRRAFEKLGHYVWSADFEPSEDDSAHHYQGDCFDIIGHGWDLLIAHPPCTYLTSAAAWALKDPDYIKYPGIGYHQKISADTLTGEARRNAQSDAVAFVERLLSCGIPKIAIENPVGNLSRFIGKPSQIIHPYMFGDDASKQTCLWLKNLPMLQPTEEIRPRIVNGKPRWGNQCDSGQNKISPSPLRWKERSRTYQGIADAMANQWST
jgi:hypothetical protein